MYFLPVPFFRGGAQLCDVHVFDGFDEDGHSSLEGTLLLHHSGC